MTFSHGSWKADSTNGPQEITKPVNKARNMTQQQKQTGYSLHFLCNYLTFILGTDHRLFSRSRFHSQHSKNSLAINSPGQWQYRSFELERRIKTNVLLLQCYETKNTLTSINFLPYSMTITLRNLQLHCFPTTLLSCLDATVADKDHFMYRESEMGEKHALLTVLRSLFLSGQMQTYWCPLWWLFVCASDNKVLSSFLMRSPGLHLWIFKENIPGEKYHGKFFFYVLTNHLLLLKYLSCCISKTI